MVDLPDLVPLNGVSAVSLNVTVTDPESSGYLTVYPCGGDPPLTSNLNFVAGQTIANAVITPLNGAYVCFYSSARVNLVVDINGWFAN
jgi:hypothetical protein